MHANTHTHTPANMSRQRVIQNPNTEEEEEGESVALDLLNISKGSAKSKEKIASTSLEEISKKVKKWKDLGPRDKWIMKTFLEMYPIADEKYDIQEYASKLGARETEDRTRRLRLLLDADIPTEKEQGIQTWLTNDKKVWKDQPAFTRDARIFESANDAKEFVAFAIRKLIVRLLKDSDEKTETGEENEYKYTSLLREIIPQLNTKLSLPTWKIIFRILTPSFPPQALLQPLRNDDGSFVFSRPSAKQTDASTTKTTTKLAKKPKKHEKDIGISTKKRRRKVKSKKSQKKTKAPKSNDNDEDEDKDEDEDEEEEELEEEERDEDEEEELEEDEEEYDVAQAIRSVKAVEVAEKVCSDYFEELETDSAYPDDDRKSTDATYRKHRYDRLDELVKQHKRKTKTEEWLDKPKQTKRIHKQGFEDLLVNNVFLVNKEATTNPKVVWFIHHVIGILIDKITIESTLQNCYVWDSSKMVDLLDLVLVQIRIRENVDMWKRVFDHEAQDIQGPPVSPIEDTVSPIEDTVSPVEDNDPVVDKQKRIEAQEDAMIEIEVQKYVAECGRMDTSSITDGEARLAVVLALTRGMNRTESLTETWLKERNMELELESIDSTLTRVFCDSKHGLFSYKDNANKRKPTSTANEFLFIVIAKIIDNIVTHAKDIDRYTWINEGKDERLLNSVIEKLQEVKPEEWEHIIAFEASLINVSASSSESPSQALVEQDTNDKGVDDAGVDDEDEKGVDEAGVDEEDDKGVVDAGVDEEDAGSEEEESSLVFQSPKRLPTSNKPYSPSDETSEGKDEDAIERTVSIVLSTLPNAETELRSYSLDEGERDAEVSQPNATLVVNPFQKCLVNFARCINGCKPGTNEIDWGAFDTYGSKVYVKQICQRLSTDISEDKYKNFKKAFMQKDGLRNLHQAIKLEFDVKFIHKSYVLAIMFTESLLSFLDPSVGGKDKINSVLGFLEGPVVIKRHSDLIGMFAIKAMYQIRIRAGIQRSIGFAYDDPKWEPVNTNDSTSGIVFTKEESDRWFSIFHGEGTADAVLFYTFVKNEDQKRKPEVAYTMDAVKWAAMTLMYNMVDWNGDQGLTIKDTRRTGLWLWMYVNPKDGTPPELIKDAKIPLAKQIRGGGICALIDYMLKRRKLSAQQITEEKNEETGDKQNDTSGDEPSPDEEDDLEYLPENENNSDTDSEDTPSQEPLPTPVEVRKAQKGPRKAIPLKTVAKVALRQITTDETAFISSLDEAAHARNADETYSQAYAKWIKTDQSTNLARRFFTDKKSKKCGVVMEFIFRRVGLIDGHSQQSANYLWPRQVFQRVYDPNIQGTRLEIVKQQVLENDTESIGLYKEFLNYDYIPRTSTTTPHECKVIIPIKLTTTQQITSDYNTQWVVFVILVVPQKKYTVECWTTAGAYGRKSKPDSSESWWAERLENTSIDTRQVQQLATELHKFVYNVLEVRPNDTNHISLFTCKEPVLAYDFKLCLFSSETTQGLVVSNRLFVCALTMAMATTDFDENQRQRVVSSIRNESNRTIIDKWIFVCLLANKVVDFDRDSLKSPPPIRIRVYAPKAAKTPRRAVNIVPRVIDTLESRLTTHSTPLSPPTPSLPPPSPSNPPDTLSLEYTHQPQVDPFSNNLSPLPNNSGFSFSPSTSYLSPSATVSEMKQQDNRFSLDDWLNEDGARSPVSFLPSTDPAYRLD